MVSRPAIWRSVSCVHRAGLRSSFSSGALQWCVLALSLLPSGTDTKHGKMCHGFARNYADLVGLRVLLGIAEAGEQVVERHSSFVFKDTFVQDCIRVLSSTCLGECHASLALYRRLRPFDSWYRRDQLGTRVAAFFTSSTIAGAFSEFHLAQLYHPPTRSY